MSGALERLRERNRADITLESGTVVTLQLPNLRDCFAAGGIPLTLLEKVNKQSQEASSNGKTALDPEETERYIEFQRLLVAKAVVAIDGESCELTPEDVSAFDDAEFYELLGYAMREKALPGKGAAGGSGGRSGILG